MTVPTMLAVFCLASVAAVTDTGSTISAGNVDETTRLMADSDIKSAFLAALRSKTCGDGMVDAYMRAVKLCGEDRRSVLLQAISRYWRKVDALRLRLPQAVFQEVEVGNNLQPCSGGFLSRQFWV